jgi:hypothetical protein
MRFHAFSIPSIMVAITCLGPLPGADASTSFAPLQDPPSAFEQDMLERQQEQMQAMQERLEGRMQEAVARKLSGLSGPASPDQSSLGIAVKRPTRQELEASGFRPGVGLKINKVLPGSPAATFLRAGDLVESIQGQWIFNRDQLVALIRCFPPGEQIRIKGVRNGRPFEKTTRLVRSDALPRSSSSSDSDNGYDFQSASDSDHAFASDSDSDSDSDHQSSSSSSSDSDSDHQSSSSSSSDSDSDRKSSSSQSSEASSTTF